MGKPGTVSANKSGQGNKKVRKFAGGGSKTGGKDSKRTKKYKATKLAGEIQKRRQIKKFKTAKKKKQTNEEDEEDGGEVENLEIEDATEDNLDRSFFEEDDQGSDDDNDQEDDIDLSEDEDAMDLDGEDDDDDESEAGKHKRELEYLKQSDPEFVKYLEENDKGLLDFEGDDGDDDDDEGDEDEDGIDMEEGNADEEAAESRKSEKKVKQDILTSEQVTQIEEQAKKGSWKALKRLLVAFRCGCLMTSEDASKLPFKINSSATFTKLMVVSIRDMHDIFQSFLAKTAETSKKGKGETPNSWNTNPSWPRLLPLINSFFVNLTTFIGQATEEEMLVFLLKHLIHYVPYLAFLKPRMAQKLLKVILSLWGSSTQESVKISAFLVVRELCLKMPYPFINTALKGSYLTFVRYSKFTNPSTMPNLLLMANCIVELYMLDTIAAYQHAFVYIRQLAIHLRNSMQLKTKAAFQNVYNWQYINSIRVWVLLLSHYAENSHNSNDKEKADLNQLVYPLVQVILGAIRLIPTARYFPLRFVCIRFLNQLSTATKLYINVAPYVLEVLDAPELKKKHKPVKSKAIDLNFLLKASKSVLQTPAYQEAVVNTIFDLLLAYFSINARSIGFPELAFSGITSMKRYNKTNPNMSLKKRITQLVEQLEKNSTFITTQRQQVDFSPKNYEKTKNFLAETKTPLEQYYAQYQANEERAKQLKKYKFEEEEQFDDSSDEEEQASSSKKKQAVKKAASTATTTTTKSASNGTRSTAGDIVEDLVLSDSDSDDYDDEDDE